LTGRLHGHRDGYGFVILDQPPPDIEGDLFIPASRMGGAMHGDRVAARITASGRGGRREGEIVRILDRTHESVVGEFRFQRRGSHVIPFDDRLRGPITIPPGMEMPPAGGGDRIGARAIEFAGPEDMDGIIVDVEIVRFPKGGQEAAGRVVEILGRREDFGVDVEMTIRKHHIPRHFPAAVLEEARRAPSVVGAGEIEGRRDFRGLDVVTIDGETARDFDDAVWVDRLSDGRFALHVHIADVGHYARPGSAIDGEARRRGTSVYFPDRAVPMLPLELSTGICSLRPSVDRLVLSALLEIDRHGDVTAQQFARGVIRSIERMTYTDVHLVLDGDAGLRARYAPLVERFELMRELALILQRKRVRRGAIDFDLPEPLIEFDEFGEMAGVGRAPRNIAHRIIEEFMLAANEAVAAHIAHAGAPSVYRIHETPDPQRVFEFEEIAQQFGVSLGIGPLPVKRYPIVERARDGRTVRKDLVRPDPSFKVGSRHYQKLIAQIEGRPEERILNYLMLRSLKQARYSADNEGHFALASDGYTHFTSPIRRYPDLMVHRILAALLDGESARYSDAQLREIAGECSDSERRAAEAERELVEWKKLRYMSDRLGEEFDALIINAVKFGFFVELEELFVEGLVPIDTLPGDRYRFHENTRRIIGERTRREFRIGGRVRVRLDRVNAIERKLEFSLLPPDRR